jgi:hypothetical protein
LQSSKPAASGGFVELLVEGEPVAVEFVLVPLMPLVLLPVLVLGDSLRTCLVTLSQHLPEEGAALGEVVVVEVWATASPMPPARSAAAAIIPIPVIRMRRILLIAMGQFRRALPSLKATEAIEVGSFAGRVTKKGACRQSSAPPSPALNPVATPNGERNHLLAKNKGRPRLAVHREEFRR